MSSLAQVFEQIKKHPFVSTTVALVAGSAAVWSWFSPEPFVPSILGIVVSVATMSPLSWTAGASLIGFGVSAVLVYAIAVGLVSFRRQAKRLAESLEVVTAERNALKTELGMNEIKLASLKPILAEYMAETCICRLERLSKKYAPEKRNATVAVRFIDFSDGPLADRIVDLFAHRTKWEPKRYRDEGSELRQPLGLARVLFESGTPEIAMELEIIFNEGNLLKEPISGREIHARDDVDIVVTIFPAKV